VIMLSAIPAQLTSNDFASMSVYPQRRLFKQVKAGTMLLLTVFCTLSKARISICRTLSRETPNSLASFSSVTGSSARRRAIKM
jgi:hypothetical protein